MTPVTDAYIWQGSDLLGSDGEKIGSVKEIYEDQRTGRPEWGARHQRLARQPLTLRADRRRRAVR